MYVKEALSANFLICKFDIEAVLTLKVKGLCHLLSLDLNRLVLYGVKKIRVIKRTPHTSVRHILRPCRRCSNGMTFQTEEDAMVYL